MEELIIGLGKDKKSIIIVVSNKLIKYWFDLNKNYDLKKIEKAIIESEIVEYYEDLESYLFMVLSIMMSSVPKFKIQFEISLIASIIQINIKLSVKNKVFEVDYNYLVRKLKLSYEKELSTMFYDIMESILESSNFMKHLSIIDSINKYGLKKFSQKELKERFHIGMNKLERRLNLHLSYGEIRSSYFKNKFGFESIYNISSQLFLPPQIDRKSSISSLERVGSNVIPIILISDGIIITFLSASLLLKLRENQDPFSSIFHYWTSEILEIDSGKLLNSEESRRYGETLNFRRRQHHKKLDIYSKIKSLIDFCKSKKIKT